METTTAIIWTQIPIAIAILIGAYELHQTRKDLIKLLEKLSKK
jgi:heme/copper-type cytochrome/quinol oxidase subunit 2